MTVLVVVETVVLALVVLLVVGLLRSHAEILRRLHDLGAGLDEPGDRHGTRPRSPGPRGVTRDQFNVFPEVPAPGAGDGFPESRDLAGVGVADDAVSIRVVGVDHTTLVAFLSSGCLTCQRFWDAFAGPDDLGLGPDVRVVVVTKDPGEESPARIADLAPAGLALVMSSEAWEAYEVPGSPYFVLIDGPSGRVRGEGTGIDWPQVRGLLTQVTDDDSYAAELDSRRVAKYGADDARERRVDDELLAAGVTPGDPSLYGDPVDPGPDPDHSHDHDHDHDHGVAER